MNKSEIAKLKVELRAAELGWYASRPVEGIRYDLILDDHEQLYRVQIKYAGQEQSGAIFIHFDKFNGKSGTRKLHQYFKEEIDVIIAYLPVVDRLCWIGPELFDGKRGITLRFAPTKNGQQKGIRQASDLFW